MRYKVAITSIAYTDAVFIKKRYPIVAIPEYIDERELWSFTFLQKNAPFIRPNRYTIFILQLFTVRRQKIN